MPERTRPQESNASPDDRRGDRHVPGFPVLPAVPGHVITEEVVGAALADDE